MNKFMKKKDGNIVDKMESSQAKDKLLNMLVGGEKNRRQSK